MAYGGVEFEGDKDRPRIIPGSARAPKMILWVMRNSHGLIQSERQAGYVLLSIVAALFLFAIVIFSFGQRTSVYDYLPNNLHSDAVK